MKIVINCVSFVSLITNSSSEIFVCNTDKTVEFIKDVLEDLLKTYNKVSGEERTFESCFAPIKVTKYGFDFYKIPEQIRQDYCDAHYGDYQSKNLPPMPFLGAAPFDNVPKRRLYLIKEPYSQEDKDIILRYYLTYFLVFIEFLKQNNLPIEEFSQVYLSKIQSASISDLVDYKFDQLFYISPNELSEEVEEAWEFFSMMESYNMEVNKGSILIQSLEDNSIPYELFGAINGLFNGENYHLG